MINIPWNLSLNSCNIPDGQKWESAGKGYFLQTAGFPTKPTLAYIQL